MVRGFRAMPLLFGESVEEKLTKWTCDVCGKVVTHDENNPLIGSAPLSNWFHVEKRAKSITDRTITADLCSVECIQEWLAKLAR